MKINIDFEPLPTLQFDLKSFGFSDMVEWEDIPEEKKKKIIDQIKESIVFPKMKIYKIYPLNNF